MKYFMDVSRCGFWVKEGLPAREVQSARVPISRAIQRINQELLIKQTVVDAIIVSITVGKMLILPIYRNTKLQI